MSRGPRIHFPGAVYHAMARGVNGQDVFLDDADRRAFLESLRRIADEQSASVLAYCLMGNHFHLALKVRVVPLAAFIQRLLTAYVCRFNRKHGREGHLFQARYKAVLCLGEAYLRNLVAYIHENPIRAGWVGRATDWPWSSAHEWRGREVGIVDSAEIMALGMREAGAIESGFDPWPDQRLRQALLRSDDVPMLPLEELARRLVAGTDADVEALRSPNRSRGLTPLRTALVRKAIENGHPIKDVAQWLGRDRSVIYRMRDGKMRMSQA